MNTDSYDCSSRTRARNKDSGKPRRLCICVSKTLPRVELTEEELLFVLLVVLLLELAGKELFVLFVLLLAN
jgi:hypothetical protein